MFQNMDYIYEVYKEKSFSRAAKNLYLSQSSLSLTVKSAEKRIGMEIFDRSQNPIRLTEFGEHYIRAVEEIRGIESRLENYIYDTNHLKMGSISIGAGNFFATYLVPPAVSAFREKYPNIQMKLIEGRTLDLAEELNKGNIDALLTNGSLDSSAFASRILFKEHMVLAVPRRFFKVPPSAASLLTGEILMDDRLFEERPGACLDNFLEVPFISLRPGNDSRIRWERLFASAHKKPKVLLELDQSSTAFSMAVSGIGACMVGDTIAKYRGISDSIWLYKLEGPEAERNVVAYTKEKEYISRAMEEFIRILACGRNDIYKNK